MQPIAFTIIESPLAVCRLPADQPLPVWAWSWPLCSITRTAEELSVVCPEEAIPPDLGDTGLRAERGWRALKVAGPLDFALTGILANIASVMARAEISIFAISTYDTDYILVRAENLKEAAATLSQAGWQVL